MEAGGAAKPTTRFGFSWADEVEREEREQVAAMQQQQHKEEEEAKREQIKAKADPFGAARPREVVLAEKGVDWRARDRELDLSAALLRPTRSAARGLNRRTAATAAASACAATPARGVPPLDRDAGRTPHPRRQASSAASAPQLPPTGRRNETPAGRSARGGSKRKFAGEGPVRGAPPVGDHAEQQGRRVFAELNVGDGCGPSFRGSAAAGNGCNCNPGGSQAEGTKAATAVAADGAPSTAVDATGLDKSAAGRKRSRGGKGRGSGKAKKQQTLLV